MDSAVDSGRLRRTARRGIAVATLGWLLAVAGSVLAAPTASAAPTATVAIRDLTPPIVSVDAGGTVTFSNQIADKPLRVGGGLLPSLVDVTVSTDVTLRLPSGTKPLPAGASVSESFGQSCAVCTITYAYRVVSSGPALTQGLIDATLGQLPALPVPTPFVVNTLVPLPNLPSANLPTLPPVTVPPAVVPSLPVPQAPVPVTPTAPVAETPTASAPAETGTPLEGTAYSYGTTTSAGQMAPVDTSAAAAFDPTRFSPRTQPSAASGGGGNAGSYDGASVPVFGELAGLGGSGLGEGAGDDVATASDTAAAGPDPALSVPALAAVVALAGVSAALVRTHLSQRTADRAAAA